MNDPGLFITKLALSFVIGGAWAIGATVAADRWGSKIGGLLASLPSTTLFALFFLAWTQTPEFAARATVVMPMVIAVENIFVLSYIVLANKGVWIALASALATWFVAAYVLVIFRFENVAAGLITYVVSFFLVYYLVEYVLHVPSATGKSIRYTTKTILFRGLLSGMVIGFAVMMGKIGGPLLGGMFSAFPAMFTSTIVITYLSRGAAFSAATMKSALLGLATVVVHALMVRVTYVPFGIWWGTLVSSFVSFTTGYIIYRIGIKRLR